jgi:hypothetical protein
MGNKVAVDVGIDYITFATVAESDAEASEPGKEVLKFVEGSGAVVLWTVKNN